VEAAMENNFFGTADLIVFIGNICCVAETGQHFDDVHVETKLPTLHLSW